MFLHDLKQIRFAHAIRTRNAKKIMAYIEQGLNVNTNDGGCYVFESLFLSKRPYALMALELLLNHPKWNPNYRTVDTFHPEERAMLHRKEDIALRIIQHPNFDKEAYPRVVQAAKRFKAKTVLKFLRDKEHIC